MATKVRSGYNILQHFTAVEIYPDEDYAGSEILDLIETYGCSYISLLPFPPDEDSPNGGVILFATPYPVTVDEAKELFEEWSDETEKGST